MAKSKFIQDKERIQYKKQLAELMQQINPKQAKELIEKLKQDRINMRDLPY
jgi:hypothetical protein